MKALIAIVALSLAGSASAQETHDRTEASGVAVGVLVPTTRAPVPDS